jgi:hypothetical protein
MRKWTSTPEEYSHVRNIMLELGGQPNVAFTMKDGSVIQGRVFGAESGTDGGENLDRGLGPVVTRMYGEIRVQTAEGEKTFSALDVKTFDVVPRQAN